MDCRSRLDMSSSQNRRQIEVEVMRSHENRYGIQLQVCRFSSILGNIDHWYGRPGTKKYVEFFPYLFPNRGAIFSQTGTSKSVRLSYPIPLLYRTSAECGHNMTYPEFGTTVLFGSSSQYSDLSTTCLNPAK